MGRRESPQPLELARRLSLARVRIGPGDVALLGVIDPLTGAEKPIDDLRPGRKRPAPR